MADPGESTQLRAARDLDAAGRHNEAIDALARATGAGDLRAMCELGHRLLIGDRAPVLPQDAVRLLVDAARAGEARALARVAALTAAGVFLPQDWTTALRLLGEAAQAGDAAARGQLASLVPTDPSADWRTHAARVALADWLQPAPTVALHDNVHRVTRLAPPPVCAWLIDRARGHLEPARVYDAVEKREMVHSMRSNTVANFTYASFDVVQFLVQARMALTCRHPLRHCEAPMILHYEVGQQITPHFDFIDARAPDYEQQIREQGQRMITFLLYLNDAYEGGETTFPELGLVNRGALGDGIYFINAHADGSPDRRMLHTGSPPTSGEKWIVTQFVRNIPQRS